MSWLVLILSGTFEAVWAGALDASDNFKKLKPSLLFLITAPISVIGLAWAMIDLPTGTAYAVWVGVGASLTVVYSMYRGIEKATLARVGLLVLLIGCVAGLKAVS